MAFILDCSAFKDGQRSFVFNREDELRENLLGRIRIYLPKSFNLMLQCDLIGQFMAWWFVFNQLKQSSLSHAIFLLSCVCFDLNTGQKATWCLCLQMTEFFYLKGFSSPALCSVIGISLALHMTSHGCCSEHQGKFLLVWQVDLT